MRSTRNKGNRGLLFIGDIAALYAALFAMLLLRYGSGFYAQFAHAHAAPFSIIFIAWLVVFYISGLYDLRRLRNNLDFYKTLSLSLVVDAALAVLVFYLVPAFGIAPKTNLLLFIVIFAVIEVLWRRWFNWVTASGEAPNQVLLIGNGTPTIEEVKKTVAENSQLGYHIKMQMSATTAEAEARGLKTTVQKEHINLVVVPRDLKNNDAFALTLYELFADGVRVMDLDQFYETIMRKVPLADIKETWFLENIESAAQFYDPLKRAWEFLWALAIFVVLLPVELLIALIVALTSPGGAIYRQERVGEHGKRFTLYKFRTMRRDAEVKGAQWATQHDARVTAFGRFLRASHLDELPQLWNIIRGDISFVGPRPERPEFVEKLKAQVPYYEVRLLVKPGVSGWAQINHRADLTLDDVREKLQYDIYYLKNRSFVLDIAIAFKTVKSLFVTPK